MKTNHTPGPWMAELAEPNITGHAPADARVTAHGELTGVVCNQAWNHDALLIAAAPELYEAAKMFEELMASEDFRIQTKSIPDDVRADAMIEKFKAAIAKVQTLPATGEVR